MRDRQVVQEVQVEIWAAGAHHRYSSSSIKVISRQTVNELRSSFASGRRDIVFVVFGLNS